MPVGLFITFCFLSVFFNWKKQYHYDVQYKSTLYKKDALKKYLVYSVTMCTVLKDDDILLP